MKKIILRTGVTYKYCYLEQYKYKRIIFKCEKFLSGKNFDRQKMWCGPRTAFMHVNVYFIPALEWDIPSNFL